MTEPLPDPVPIIIGGSGVSTLICDTDRDTCVNVEESPDDDHIRLIARNTEVVTINEDGVFINEGYTESKIDILTESATLESNQKIIKLDLSNSNKIFTLPPCSANEGRQYTIVRIDSNSLYSATIMPTLGEKINNVINETITLYPGCHVTLQCVGATDGWYIGL